MVRIHHRLITAIAISLAPALRPKYFVAVEERIYETTLDESTLIGVPDDIVVAAKNKRPGEGRKQYEEKRQKVLGSDTHLVEIDLLRQWQPMPFFASDIQSHYRILVSRSDRRPQADLYAFNLQNLIPTFPLPLQEGDTEPLVNLHALLNEIYDQGSYDLRLDYQKEPVPALPENDSNWVNAWLQQKGLRTNGIDTLQD
jgi:hypothetical protein